MDLVTVDRIAARGWQSGVPFITGAQPSGCREPASRTSECDTTGAGRACFNIGDRQIADVMTPRLDVHWIDAEDPPSARAASDWQRVDHEANWRLVSIPTSIKGGVQRLHQSRSVYPMS